MTPDSESVLDRLETLEREIAAEADRAVFGSQHLHELERKQSWLVRNHLRALLDVARAAERYPFDAFSLDKLRLALAPLTTPSEQNPQTESESRDFVPPCKGVEEGSV